MPPSVTESKIKRFSNFISQILPKHTLWESKSKSHQNIPMNLWDSNHSKQTLSLFYSPSSSLRSLRSWSEIVYPLERKENVNNGKLKRYHEKTRQLSRFWNKNSIYVVRLNLTTHTTHTISASFREIMNVSVWVGGCVNYVFNTDIIKLLHQWSPLI